MDIFSSATLGVVQGLTEFLPVSSTGHLILAREVLGLQTEFGLAVDAVLHLATALAVLIYFRMDFIRYIVCFWKLVTGKVVERKDKIVIIALILGTIPAVVAGLFLEDYIDTVFRSAELVAWALVGGSILFVAAEKLAKKNAELTVGKGIAIGFFQALALIPGMSRSGMTISGGLLLGLTRDEAARFGFLLSFPVILGAGMLKFLELGAEGLLSNLGLALIVGALTAFLSGMAAIHFLLRYLKNHTLYIFVWYRLALAVLVLVLLA